MIRILTSWVLITYFLSSFSKGPQCLCESALLLQAGTSFCYQRTKLVTYPTLLIFPFCDARWNEEKIWKCLHRRDHEHSRLRPSFPVLALLWLWRSIWCWLHCCSSLFIWWLINKVNSYIFTTPAKRFMSSCWLVHSGVLVSSSVQKADLKIWIQEAPMQMIWQWSICLLDCLHLSSNILYFIC